MGGSGDLHIPVYTFDAWATYGQTVWYLVKACIGAGVLALPKAFADCGLLVGIVGLAFIVLLNIAAVWLIVATLDSLPRSVQLQRRPGQSAYSFVAWATMGRLGVLLVDFCMPVTLLGSVIVYLDFIAELVTSLSPAAVSSGDVIGACFLVLLPISWVRSVEGLKRYNQLALGMMLVAFVACFIHGFSIYGWNASPQIWQPHGLAGTMQFFGIAMFALGTPMVAPQALEELHPQQRDSFMTAVVQALVAIFVLYSAIGVVSVSIFSLAEGGVKSLVLKNLPPVGAVRIVCNLAIAFFLVLSAPLLLMIAFASLEQHYRGRLRWASPAPHSPDGWSESDPQSRRSESPFDPPGGVQEGVIWVSENESDPLLDRGRAAAGATYGSLQTAGQAAAPAQGGLAPQSEFVSLGRGRSHLGFTPQQRAAQVELAMAAKGWRGSLARLLMKHGWRLARSVVLAALALAAYAVPQVTIFCVLIGGFTISVLSFIMPPVFFLLGAYKTPLERVLAILFTLFGVAASFYCTFLSVMNMIAAIRQEERAAAP